MAFDPLSMSPRTYGEAIRTIMTIRALDQPVPGMNRKQRRIAQKRMRKLLGPEFRKALSGMRTPPTAPPE